MKTKFANARSLGLLCLVATLAACDDDKIVEIEVPVEVPVEIPVMVNAEHAMLTDPFLQLPTESSVSVVWFTNFEGTEHTLQYGETTTTNVVTTSLTRMMEDASSQQFGKTYDAVSYRSVFRHEAVAEGLTQGERVEYSVSSKDEDGFVFASDTFTLAPAPAKDAPLKILLTSDLQSKKNVVANYQKVVETVGVPDAVLFAGDFVNVPDRASEWFDQAKDNAPGFFPALQGHYQKYLPGFPYNGGEILQHSPLFGTIGNHEVMGRYRPTEDDYSLNGGFNDPQPAWYAEAAYEQVKADVNPTDDAQIKAQWIADQSHNQNSFLDIFSFPDDGQGGEEYYATVFGDVFIISMNVSRIWRSWSVSGASKSKFVESLSTLEDPSQWGFGEFLFERFDKDSEQYAWLESVMQTDAFKNAKYKVVMAHQGVFGLGDNTVPVLSQPVMQLVETDAQGLETITEFTFPLSTETWTNDVEPMLSNITEVRYQYPLAQDVWLNDIEPLLLENGVDLVHIGHSHLWNRAQVEDLHYLESSNVGNSYGAYYVDSSGVYTNDVRSSYADFWADVNSENPRWAIEDYPPNGDPQGRAMSFPTVFSPMSLENDAYPNLPFVTSNTLSVFSILDTGTGTVQSYVFDPTNLNSEVQLFDEFSIE
ncbi:fibronectin type III domain-containing protein [Aliiglaciecola sp. 2_MG-2023]|uniref:fibronectin type III domain-containing protein n=2 Tax=Aliiglaciecola TaxID=1406885 RepID=UPI0026E376E5|nr:MULTISPECIES: fibronectin type III domain-containing protein [unclassified Aliiglaciecola]MDO6711582.1 fibronectin type III domain-containing protein [Aliiglaciecola sp. 2_MG-2023]MDO6752653.1 fibronectin type III domain-containing protein [Aliiglaciecola sp. 1_MG-2023]